MTLINLLLTLTIGFLLVSLLMPKKALLERLGLAFPVGIGAVTLLMFLLNWLIGMPLTLAAVLLLESVTSLILLAISLPRVSFAFRKPKLRLSLGFSSVTSFVLLGVVAAFVSASVAIATYWPPYIFDTLANFDFRGRVFAQEGTITGIADVLHASYPLLTSLAHTWAYLTGIDNPKFIYPLFYLSLLIVFWALSRRHLSALGSTTLTLILAATPIVFEHSTISYTNLAHSFYLSLGIIFLAEYFLARRADDVLAASTLFGFTAWVRPAGETYWVAFGLLLLTFLWLKRMWRQLVPFFVIFLIIKLSWKFYQQKVLQVDTYDEFNLSLFTGLLGGLNWAKIEPVWGLFWTNLKDPEFLGGAGWLFGFTSLISLFLLKFFKQNQAFLMALLVTLGAIGVWTGISLLIGQSWGWGSDWHWILGQSMRRMFIIFPPLFLYVVATSPLVKSVFPKEAR